MTTTHEPKLARTQGQDPLLSLEEAAGYLTITKATLYTWRSRRPGFGPRAVKVGGCVRYRQSELDDWIRAHTEAESLEADPGDSQRGRAAHPELGISLTRRGQRG